MTAGPAGSSLEVVTGLLDLRPIHDEAPAGPADRPGHRLGLVSGRSGPRFLVPLDHPAATVSACLAYQGLRDPRTRLNRRIVGAAFRAGVGRAVVRHRFETAAGPGSLLEHLGRQLGRDDLVVAVGLGRMDELWRPTLQVFDARGVPVAFVKVGRGPVVSHLVATEAEVLRRWADLDDPRLVVPDVLGLSTWRDQPILSVAPMPADARRLPPGAVGAWPVRTLDPPVPDRPISDAPWWTDRRERFGDDPVIDSLLDRIEQRHRAGSRAWARWHGDWVPWNLARSTRGLVAWDWEYSEPGAPVGLDETHFAYQVAHLGHGRSVREALATARRVAPSAWVAEAHTAMLITRAGDLARIAGGPVTNHHEVLAAAAAVIR